MADWRISREKIELFPHPNPEVERLELGKVGEYQIVCQKGLYKNGQIVIFIPDKSVLPLSNPIFEPYKNYLTGPNKDRVKAIKLQKELSCGIILPDMEEFKDVPIGEDISNKLGVTKYEPPIPEELLGKVKPVGSIDGSGFAIYRHDVQFFNLYSDQIKNEDILITEKIHGSLLAIIRTIDGRRLVSSKGLLKSGLVLEEDKNNAYWKAAYNTRIFDILDNLYPQKHVQVFGEIVPIQKGYSYNFTNITALFYRVDINNKELHIDNIPNEVKSKFVPILYRGKFDLDVINELKNGNETVSGKGVHQKEGIVVSSLNPRKFNNEGYSFMLKVLNPKYKDDDNAFS